MQITDSARMHRQKIGLGILAIVVLLALKYHFGTAQAGQLQWLLGPLASMVQLLTGYDFIFDPHHGYINHDHHIIIAPACSGLNFLLIALTLSSLQGFTRLHTPIPWILWLFTALFWAYTYTLMGNTIRIILSVLLYNNEIAWGFFTQERIHRLVGVIVYYPALLLLYRMNEHVLPQICRHRKTLPRRSSLLLPFLCYTGFTVVIPLIRPHNRPPHLAEHLFVILLVSSCLSLVFFLLSLSKKRK